MNIYLIFTAIWFYLTPAQTDVVGTWVAYDDKTEMATSHIQIYEKDGLFYGQVVAMLRDDPSSLCTKCTGHLKNKPIMKMEILKSMQFNGEYWTDGTIMDPDNGKTYKCNIHLEDRDVLTVRGYIGAPLFGRSQRWVRTES